MNPAVTNLMVSLGAMQVARRIPFDDPEVLHYVRLGYIAAQLICLATFYVVSYRIKAKNDQTVLKYVEPKSPMSPESGGLVTTTVRDYDLAETSKLVVAFTWPLFIQGLMGLKNLIEAKPVAIHIFGRPATGNLKRPFKAPGGLFGAGEPQTDAASIKEAEKIAAKKDE
ncbi:inorganic phosphate transporter PHO88 [Rhizoctonia solani]|uniref:Inorganic phosphate transporter PHO88 n=1 Tax=Rhizoctonia solani TaxID=456999 RepID=A0A8H8STL5_9AGAM|nr:inorganic phosphate transporter PHO88 [Rhizoctonia solani]QRW17649.1 inorganic phosphate transporter PHO88 [Rhizoctonia solani]